MSASVKPGWQTSEGQIQAAVLVANLGGTLAGKVHPAWLGLVIGAAQAAIYAVSRAHVKGKALGAADAAVAVKAAVDVVVPPAPVSPAAG